MSTKPIKAGISQGDINGIGYEIIIKTLLDNRIYDFCTPILYGSPKVAAYHRKAVNAGNLNFNNVRHAGEAYDRRVNILNCLDDNVRVELGKITRTAGEAAFSALKQAVADLKEQVLDVLVTAPIHKQAMQLSEFGFTGHTEYLQHELGREETLMFMINENMRIGVVTGHLPLREVPGAITSGKVEAKIRIMNDSLKKDFAIRKPRIAVLGLNPHAGDSGLMGDEEQKVIVPVVEKLRNDGILVLGPYPSDGFFGSGAYKNFDGILAMYHDQGLTPFKALSFETSINYTAGLPVVRTSPAHGTALELAGKGEASEQSFRSALYLAVDIFRNREMYDELNKDPLRPQNVLDRNARDETPDLSGEEDQ